MKQTARNAFVLVCITPLILLIVGLTTLNSSAVGQEPKRVFVLNSYHQGYPFSDNEMRGIDDAFGKSGIKVETYITNMDMKRIPPAPQYFSQLKELIREGYKGIRFNAVIACDNDALEFIRKYRDELFPGVPVVFTGINDFDERMLDGRKDITGTIESNDYAGTINIALKLLPATKNIVIVTDNTTTGKAHRSAVEKIRREFPQSLGFTHLSFADMTLDELAQKLSTLNRDSIVLLLQNFVDRNGTSHTLQESTLLLAKTSSVPAFIVTDARLGLGVLGGHLVSGYSQGETAAQMAVKILTDTDIRTIPVLFESPNKYMFDYSVMQRFNIAESDLPQGSIIINKPVSVLDRYRHEVLFISGVLTVLSGFVVFLLLEIRRRRKIEQTLRESEEKHRILFESAGDVIFIHDTEGHILAVNPLACERLGYSHAELMSLPLGELDTPEENKYVPERITLLMEHGHLTFETVHQRKDGSPVPTEVSARIIIWDGKQVMMSICRNITERKQAESEKAKLEAQLLQSQKMEAIGQLAGGIAHDFNNILCAITGFGSLLNQQLKEDVKGTQYVSDILQAADRAAALTQNLLAFSRKQHIKPQPMDLNATIQKTEKILARTIGEDIHLSLQLTEGNTAVHADSNQITQILINLAANARDAMPKGGALTIGTARIFIDEAFMKMHGYGSSGEYIVMTVADGGVGMDEETKKRVFEPFFTTKEVGKGTGLGLSMVYGIVKQHNGFIDVYSEVGTGTVFKVYLPALEMRAETHESHENFEHEGATETILVVEDDSMVRRALTQMLQSGGHTVIEACDGDEAVTKFLAYKNDIHLVLMDVIMPRKSGGDAYQELKAIQPDVKLIFMSGYAGDYLTGKLGVESDVHFISKPINPKELFEKIRSVLSGGTT